MIFIAITSKSILYYPHLDKISLHRAHSVEENRNKRLSLKEINNAVKHIEKSTAFNVQPYLTLKHNLCFIKYRLYLYKHKFNFIKYKLYFKNMPV